MQFEINDYLRRMRSNSRKGSDRKDVCHLVEYILQTI